MEIGDGILANFLTAAANLPEEHERLVRATATLDFHDMKDRIQRVFGEIDSQDGGLNESTLPVKEEVFYTKGTTQREKNTQDQMLSEKQEVLYTRGASSDHHQGVDVVLEDKTRVCSGWQSSYRNRCGSYQGAGSVYRCYECGNEEHFI